MPTEDRTHLYIHDSVKLTIQRTTRLQGEKLCMEREKGKSPEESGSRSFPKSTA